MQPLGGHVRSVCRAVPVKHTRVAAARPAGAALCCRSRLWGPGLLSAVWCWAAVSCCQDADGWAEVELRLQGVAVLKMIPLTCNRDCNRFTTTVEV